jgi:N-acyl-D-aspartate/D-glutamate deacylase
MQADLIIRGGTVVDGLGGPPRQVDVLVAGDIIIEIGDVSAEQAHGAREIDATGLIVTPGFIDMHTHLDAQIGWDPDMTPVSWHGVTTALLGNCGVTFAPCKPGGQEQLAAMMETVEDIPKQAILDGLSWQWETYGEYLDSLETLQPAVNVTGMVGHCAIRYYVMGERGVAEQPTDAELVQMADIAEQAIKDGAVGFSSSRLLGHFLPDGRHIPGTHAEHHELIEIAKRVGAQGGLMQSVMNFATAPDTELELLASEARTGSRVLFSAGARSNAAFGNQLKSAIGGFREEGLDIHAVTIPRAGGFLSNLHSGFLLSQICPFVPSSANWQRLFDMPFPARLDILADTEFVDALVSDAEHYNLEHEGELDKQYRKLFWLGDSERPDYANESVTLADLAADAGLDPARLWLNMMRDSQGRALFNYHLFNPKLDLLEDVMTTDWCMPGLGDAGAHVGQVMDCGWATFALSYWHRDRGVYSLEEAVRRITAIPAHVLNISDRGTLAVGMKADINVIDLQGLSERQPEFAYDFPNNSGRFIQRATGYRATICNGQVVVENDELTGNRAGSVLRHQASAV